MPASGIQNIGLTALLTFQRALQVTAHNIANAGTPGYSRQSVDFSSLQGGLTPAGVLGAGVEISQIRRGFDQLLFKQLTQTTSALVFFVTRRLPGVQVTSAPPETVLKIIGPASIEAPCVWTFAGSPNAPS